MNSTFWAINAAKKKRSELVPGTSRWVANELYLINSDVLNCTENDFQEVRDGIDQMNYFIQRALDAQGEEGSRIEFLTQLDEKAARNNTPANFSYISPAKINMIDGFSQNKALPQSSPIRRRAREKITHKQALNPKTPSPLKNLSAIRRSEVDSGSHSAQYDEKEEYAIVKDINDGNNNFLAPSLDDSFQAISTAIRKSIAGKSAADSHSITGIRSSSMGSETRTNKAENAMNESKNTTIVSEKINKDAPVVQNASLSRESTRKSEYKTPKRSSIFVSLPSREPIAISSSTKSRQSMRPTKYSGPMSNSSRVFERLDIASRREISSVTGNSDTPRVNSLEKDSEFAKSYKNGSHNYHTPVSDINSNEKINQNTKSEIKSATEIPNISNYIDRAISNDIRLNIKGETPSATIPYKDKEIGEKNSTNFLETPHKEPNSIKRINSIESVLRRARNALQNTANKIETIQDANNRVSSRDVLAKPKIYDRKIVEKDSLNSSDNSPVSFRSRSPKNSKLNEKKFKRSPLRDKLNSDKKTALRGSESELINRLMTPTGSSAAKNTRAVSSSKTTHNIPSRIPDGQKKNRFLTTTLNYNNGDLNGNKNQNLKTIQSSVKPQTSPIKKTAMNMDEQEIRMPLKLETLSIPNLKKKSLMAERSEAAAQKPKQKIVIAVNHKYDLKGKSKVDTPLKGKKSDSPENQNDLTTNTLEDKRNRNEYYSPDHPFNISKANEKRLKSGYIPYDDQTNSKEAANKRRKTLRDAKANSNFNSKSSMFDKKSFQIPSYDRKTTDKTNKEVESLTDSKTPTRGFRASSDFLPDIESDEDDNNSNKEKRILRSWASTPELHKLVMQNRSINPVSIFGEVPKLNINEVFESQVSRYRGEQSPLQWSPKDKRRKKEERDYAVQMGYIR